MTFWTCFFSRLSNFNDGKIMVQLTTRGSGNVQSHDQEESKLNSTIYAKSGAHAFKDNKIMKGLLNNNNVATIESK